MKALTKLFNNSLFIKRTGTVAGGIFLGQAITIFASPLLTRIFNPADFGALSIFSSILAILSVSAALRLELAIPLPKEDIQGRNLVFLSILSVIITSSLIFVIIYFFTAQIIEWSDYRVIQNYLYLLPIGVFSASIYQIFTHWAIRKEQYQIISKTRIIQGASGVTAQIILGVAGFRPIGLIIGAILKQASGFITLSRIFLKEITVKDISPQSLKATLKRYRKFPLVSSFSAIINILGLNLPVLIVAYYYGETITGNFALSMMVIGVPLTTLGKAISQVFLGTSSQIIRENLSQLRILYFKIAKILFLLAIIPTLTLLFSPQLFTLIFGEKWLTAGIITRILSIMYLIQFITIPLAQLLPILEKQGVQLAWDVLRLIIILASLILPAIYKASFLITFKFFSAAMFFMYLLLFLIHIYFLYNTTIKS